LQEVKDQFVSIRRFEDIEYVRPDATQEAIKFDFIWEDIDRELFDDPETEEIEGITHFKLIVPYTKSRGNTGEVSVSRQIGLEEHEAYGFAYIESNLLEVIDSAEAEGAVVTCSTAVDDWYADCYL